MNLESSQVLSVQPNQIRAYLSRTGWTKEDYSKQGLERYVFNQSPNLYLLLPTDRQTRDYADAILKTFRVLSQVEGRTLGGILKNVLLPNQDELRFRFKGSFADSTSLPMDYTIKAIQNIRDSLIYSACAELSPQAFYPRKLKEAKLLAEKSRFGQTEVGSFVMNVEMPLERPVRASSGAQETQSMPEPIERRIFTRVVRSVAKAQSVAIMNESIDVDNEFRSGLNANLAESLSALGSDDGIEVEVTPIWDIAYPAPPNLSSRSYTLDRTLFDTFKAIGQTLRGESISTVVELVGTVTSLSREDSDEDEEDVQDDDSIGSVTISPISPENLPTKKVRVALNATYYLSESEGHRDKKRVKIRGRLEKLGKFWHLTSYDHLSIL